MKSIKMAVVSILVGIMLGTWLSIYLSNLNPLVAEFTGPIVGGFVAGLITKGSEKEAMFVGAATGFFYALSIATILSLSTYNLNYFTGPSMFVFLVSAIIILLLTLMGGLGGLLASFFIKKGRYTGKKSHTGWVKWIIIAAVAVIVTYLFSFALRGSISEPTFVTAQGLTLAGSSNSLTFTVIATNQVSPAGSGPECLLSVLTNKGHWYEIGVSYNFLSDNGSIPIKGFSIIIYPTVGNGTLYPADIRNNDSITLKASITNDTVFMTACDLNFTRAGCITQRYPAYNATYFVGGPYSNNLKNGGISNSNGEFTGLMTEQQNIYNYSVKSAATVYRGIDTNVSLWYEKKWGASSTLTCPTGRLTCNMHLGYYTAFVNPFTKNYSLSYENLSEYVNGTVFVTR